MARPKLYPTDTPCLWRDTEDARPTSKYYADFTVAGKRSRQVLGRGYESSKTKLQDLMKEAKFRAGQEDESEEPPATLSELQSRHLFQHMMRIRESTRESYAGRDKNAIEGLGDIPIKFLRKRDIEAWIARRAADTSPSNANRDLTRLRQVMKWAENSEWIDRDPTKGIRKFREPKKRKNCLTSQQEARLQECCRDWLWGMARFSILTGMRQHEVLNLTWDQIEFGQVTLESDETKGHSRRFVPLHPDCLAILEKQRKHPHQEKCKTGLVWPNKRGNPYDRTSFRTWYWRPAFDMAGLEGWVWHDLRHTFCSRLQRRGIDIVDIAELAGHEDLRTTRGYTHAAREKLVRAIMNQE